MERLAGKEVAKLVVDVILNNPYTYFFTPYYKFNLIKSDPDDNKFFDCAIMANAKFIIAEDRHFNVLNDYSFPKVNIIGLDAFLQSLI